jgi:hypothetical protein
MKRTKKCLNNNELETLKYYFLFFFSKNRKVPQIEVFQAKKARAKEIADIAPVALNKF